VACNGIDLYQGNSKHTGVGKPKEAAARQDIKGAGQGRVNHGNLGEDNRCVIRFDFLL
jgi:hypothetical protein